MKKIFTIALIALLTTANAQNNKRITTITLKNGTELKGYAKISGFNIRFSETRRGKDTKYNHEEIDFLKIKVNNSYKTLTYKLEKGKKKPILLEILIQGKVNLYIKDDRSYSPNGGSYGSIANSLHNSVPKYFVEKENEDSIIRFKQNFNKQAKEFFKDCSNLTEQIGKKYFRRKDTFEIVEYYNENCN